ncbi:hypothetical protein AB0F17_28695 [Nonomuraea sp. NPDC026600]|uniref:hypothetical protein n=1 Tax=Nonomuraea sp. NPDC026600 TaxID=3155363 RepID=UPI0033EF6183
MIEPSPLNLAEVGYQAYGNFADWTNFAGNTMPTWAELPEPQRCAWVAAAGAIRSAVLTPPGRGRPRSAYEASHPMMIGRSAATAAAVCKCPGGCCGHDAGPQHAEVGDARAAEPGGRA